VRVEPTWKTKTESALPPPSRVTVPVSDTVVGELYTPGVSERPPRSEVMGVVGPCPAALAYAVRRSLFACWVTASPS
jgi:hypothetical protein